MNKHHILVVIGTLTMNPSSAFSQDQPIDENDPFRPGAIFEETNKERQSDAKKLLYQFIAVCSRPHIKERIFIESRSGSFEKDENSYSIIDSVNAEQIQNFGKELSISGKYIEDSEAEVFCEFKIPKNDKQLRAYLVHPTILQDKVVKGAPALRLTNASDMSFDFSIEYPEKNSAYLKLLASMFPTLKNFKSLEAALLNQGYRTALGSVPNNRH